MVGRRSSPLMGFDAHPRPVEDGSQTICHLGRDSATEESVPTQWRMVDNQDLERRQMMAPEQPNVRLVLADDIGQGN